MGAMPVPTFREVQDVITSQLREQGFLAAVLVDLGPLARIERAFGGTAFRTLRAQVDPLLVEMRERFRQDDVLTRDESEGDRFLLFLSAPRRTDTPFRSEKLRKIAERAEEFLNPRVGRLTVPYLKERPVLVAGYGLVLWSPLEGPERQVLRLVDDAIACAEIRARYSNVRSARGSSRSSRTASCGRRSSRSWRSGPGAPSAGRGSRAVPGGPTSSRRSRSSGGPRATASPRSSSAPADARRSSTGGSSASEGGCS
jgi:hypothetical protein